MSIVHRLLLGSVAAAVFAHSPAARACGGFFCGRQPVDQTAERILFEVGQDSVTMTTQISFNGEAADFAWVLPLNAVPDPESLAVFPQRALTALDANTGPVFYEPCLLVPSAATGDPGLDSADDSVTVHIRAEVGDYEVAVIESTDPDALVDWLRNEDYRVTEPMEPYIELYTNEGMKFLALKLLDTADVNDIKPFRFTLPGNSPSIPLRMTSLAAEPEMSIVVFVLGDSRYEAKNWENISIDDADIRFVPNTWPVQTNWAALVAKGVDEAGGQGWVTEFAGSTEGYVVQLENQIETGIFTSEEDEEAAHALLDVLRPYPYLTRLYSRLSAEEMTSDPIFGRSGGGDVSQVHMVENPDDENQCTPDSNVDPCEFVTCGAGGTCRTALVDAGNGAERMVTGCACVPGATARTTFAPDGSAIVICQDQRMSFLNPGDQEAGTETLPDPCATFDCGAHGSCVAVNMTPTCVCDRGYIAVGSFSEEGQRTTTCVQPEESIDASFYDQRLPDLPSDLPGGRPVSMPEPGTGGGPSSSADSSGSGGTSTPGEGSTASDNPTQGASGGGGCSVPAKPGRSHPLELTALGLLGVWVARRQRTTTRAR